MAEMDAFDRSLASAFLRLVDDVPSEVDGIAVAHRVAREHPRRRTGAVGRGLVAIPRLVLLLLLIGLLAAAGAGALLVGARLTVPPLPALLGPLPEATPAQNATLAPDAAPIAVPPGQLTPLQEAQLGVPVVTPSALGRIAWTLWLPPDSSTPIPVSTPHGPVLLDGANLIWRGSSGSWKAAPVLGTATWPGVAVGDDLILADTPGPARFHWADWEWVRADPPKGLDGFPMSGLVTGSNGSVAFGIDGMRFSSGAYQFVPVADGPDCILSVAPITSGFVALSGTCDGRGVGSSNGGIDTTLLQQWYGEPIPWTSTDGMHWRRAGVSSPFGPGAIVLGVASREGRQVAVGVAPSDGGTQGAASYSEATAWVSDDALAWRRLPLLPSAPTGLAVTDWGRGFRTVVAGEAGWLIQTHFGNTWTSVDGLTWEPLDGQPKVFGYEPSLPAMGRDQILVGGIGQDRVAIGAILDP